MRSGLRSLLPLLLGAFAVALAGCDAEVVVGVDDEAAADEGSGGGGDGVGAAPPVTSAAPIGGDGDGDDDGEDEDGEDDDGSAGLTDCDTAPVQLFDEPVNTCGNDHCCAEMTLCASDMSLCADESGWVDPWRPGGGALLACLTENACIEPEDWPICDSGLWIGASEPDAAARAACLTESCCDAFSFCTSGQADVQACIDCFDAGGGPVCDPALACAAEECGWAISPDACEDDVDLFDEPDLNACGSASCCAEMTACAGDPSLCFDEDGAFDTSLPAADALGSCLASAGCFEGDVIEICDSAMAFGTGYPNGEAIGHCLDETCCAEFNVCSQNGSAADACIDCLTNGGGPLCDAASTCAAGCGYTP